MLLKEWDTLHDRENVVVWVEQLWDKESVKDGVTLNDSLRSDVCDTVFVSVNDGVSETLYENDVEHDTEEDKLLKEYDWERENDIVGVNVTEQLDEREWEVNEKDEDSDVLQVLVDVWLNEWVNVFE
jgi:hypothetical protein